jgi:hypothetical protein
MKANKLIRTTKAKNVFTDKELALIAENCPELSERAEKEFARKLDEMERQYTKGWGKYIKGDIE